MNVLGLFLIVPATMLLTVSFFVLFVLERIQKESLKTFGKVVVILLWIAAGIVFTAGLTIVITGWNPCQAHRSMKCGMMMGKGLSPMQEGMHPGMMGDQTSGMPMHYMPKGGKARKQEVAIPIEKEMPQNQESEQK